MSSRELNKYLKKLHKLNKEVASSKAASRKFLMDMGVITKTGKITKAYQNLCIPEGQG